MTAATEPLLLWRFPNASVACEVWTGIPHLPCDRPARWYVEGGIEIRCCSEHIARAADQLLGRVGGP